MILKNIIFLFSGYISLFEVWLIIVITHSIYSLNFSLTVFLVITSRNDQVLNFLEHVTYYVLWEFNSNQIRCQYGLLLIDVCRLGSQPMKSDG